MHSRALTRVVFRDPIGHVILSNAAKRNALSSAALECLSESIEKVSRHEASRLLVLSAEEGNVFSSGHDLKEMRAMTTREQMHLFDLCARVMRQIQALKVPVLASLDGLAAAAGLQLLSACDMAVCTDKSTFQLPGVRFGLFCTTPAVYAYRTSFNPKMLMHMLCTGNAISAEEALRVGFVSHTFAGRSEMDTFVQKTGEEIAQLPRDVITMGKQAFLRQTQLRNTGEAMNFASEVMVDNLSLDSCKVGLDAFANKEKPKWD